MGNNIALAKKYVDLLDEVYQASALTSVLESDAELARAGANTNEIVIPKLSMDGLADYDRNSGYVAGDAELTWETAKFNYERGRMFTIDDMDDEETQNIAFGKLAGEFVRTRVVPELDAFRFATYASVDGAGVKSEDLEDGVAVMKAIEECVTAMDDAEVPETERHLFITPAKLNAVKSLDTTKSRELLESFASITKVPQARFNTAIDLLDGKTLGEEKGGYKKADGGKAINFMCIHKPAVLQFTKHAVPKIITPELNQDADAWKYGYRNYGLCEVYENKVAGIYVSHASK